MKRKFLEEQGFTKEQIDAIMAEHGKAVTEASAKAADELTKATASHQTQIAKLEKQNEEFQAAIASNAGLDAESKKKIEDMQKEHDKQLKELKNGFDNETAKLRREADTKEFLRGLGKEFANLETQNSIEARMNEALTDKAYEGKNRADILPELIKGEDGKERTDIWALPDTNKTAPPETGGSTKPIPAAFTAAQIKEMSPEEINANWDSIKTTLGRGVS